MENLLGRTKCKQSHIYLPDKVGGLLYTVTNNRQEEIQ